MIRRRDILKGAVVLGGAGLASDGAFGQASGLQTARGVYSAPGLVFAGMFVAERFRLWEKNGLNATLKQVQGGSLAMVALTNRESEFAGVANSDPLIGWDKGISTVAIAAFAGSLNTHLVARKDWMAKVGVSPESPLADKLKAFKGARIGSSTIGGGPSQIIKYLAQIGGLDPERDIKIFAVGFGTARILSLKTNQVDFFIGGSPEADQVTLDGFGELFLNCGQDVPIFKEFPYTLVIVTPKFADENPELVRRVAQTVGEANDTFYSRFGEVVDLFKQQYATVPAKAVELALERERSLKSYAVGGRMNQVMWENSIKFAQSAQLISKQLDAREGVLWTNRFLS